jgi:hypothetical protein
MPSTRSINSGYGSWIIHCDTKDMTRSSGQVYSLVLDDSISIPPRHRGLISLSSAEIPNSFYIVNFNNNTLKGTHDTIPFTITIPEGNYTVGSLRSKLEDLLNTQIDNHFDVFYNSDTFKYTFSSTGSNHITILDFATSTCNQLCGFPTTGTGTIRHNVSSYTSEYVIDLTYTPFFYFMSNFTDIQSLDSLTKRNTNVLAKVPIDVNSGGIIYYDRTQVSHEILFSSKYIQELSVELLDSFRRPVSLNGLNYSFSITIHIIEEPSILGEDRTLGQLDFVNLTPEEIQALEERNDTTVDPSGDV